MGAPVRIPLVARPGSPNESISWDRWRNAWIVRIREPAERGAANAALRAALARWLAVPPEDLRWIRAGRSSRKLAEVTGLSPSEVDRRLRRAAEPAGG